MASSSIEGMHAPGLLEANAAVAGTISEFLGLDDVRKLDCVCTEMRSEEAAGRALKELEGALGEERFRAVEARFGMNAVSGNVAKILRIYDSHANLYRALHGVNPEGISLETGCSAALIARMEEEGELREQQANFQQLYRELSTEHRNKLCEIEGFDRANPSLEMLIRGFKEKFNMGDHVIEWVGILTHPNILEGGSMTMNDQFYLLEQCVLNEDNLDQLFELRGMVNSSTRLSERLTALSWDIPGMDVLDVPLPLLKMILESDMSNADTLMLATIGKSLFAESVENYQILVGAVEAADLGEGDRREIVENSAGATFETVLSWINGDAIFVPEPDDGSGWSVSSFDDLDS